MTALVLHDYWRSSAGYRVRIALALKGIACRRVAHDLRVGEQRAPDYASLNPQKLVPALETGDGVLVQSPAIIEWLEEAYPDPPLLPADRAARAVARGMAATIACDIHPLNNLRVLNALRDDLGIEDDARTGWARHWIADGFSALEVLVARHGGRFGHCDAPGIVDCHLVPQLYSARRFGLDLSPYPRLVAAGEAAASLPAVAAAHPDRQADADSV